MIVAYIILIFLCIGSIFGSSTMYNHLHIELLTTNNIPTKVLLAIGIAIVCILGCVSLGLLIQTIYHMCIMLI